MIHHTQGHRKRLRERMLKAPEELQDYEVLELFLAMVILRRDTKPLAKELLHRFKSVRGVLDARPAELKAVPGFGPALSAHWVLLRELMTRYAESPIRQWEVLGSPEAVGVMARQRLRGCDHEEIWVAYLDTQNRLLAWEQNAKGTLETTQIYPRDVMERALTLKANALIVVHNHPGGNPRPSGADIDLTHKLIAAAKTLNIRFLDHIIVTDDMCYSMEKEGLLSQA